VKAFANRGEEPRIHFWRTSAGTEVDLVVEARGKLIPIEVKLSRTSAKRLDQGLSFTPEKSGCHWRRTSSRCRSRNFDAPPLT
jgi:predicted AAA+ superfamily ATPase